MSRFVTIVEGLSLRLATLPSRKQTLSYCIQSKLQHSYDMYNDELQDSFGYLLSRDNLKVVKTMARQKR